MEMRKALAIPILLAGAPQAMGQAADGLPKQPPAPPRTLDLHVDQQEHIEVRGKSRFSAAPVPGHSLDAGPGTRAVYDPKTGASICEFGWAYVLAAP